MSFRQFFPGMALTGMVCFILATSLHAQDTLTVAPGDPSILVALLKPYSATFSMSMSGAGASHPMGVMKDSVWFAAGKEGKQLIRVQTVMGGVMKDSAAADARSLTPISLVGRNPRDVTTFRYTPASVTATRTFRKNDSTAVFTSPMVRPYFDSNIQDLVVRLLPLKTGYTARFGTYYLEGGGFVWLTLHVRASDTLRTSSGALRDVWIVETTSADIPTTYWIDKESRDILKFVTRPMPNAEMVVERK